MRKKPLLCVISCCIALLASAGAAARYAWPRYQLWSADRELNQLYKLYRPFPYRWVGAPFSSTVKRSVPTALLARVVLTIRHAEGLIGRNPRSVQLLARADLLAGSYDEAVAKENLALLLDPNSAAIRLESGIALALRAGSDNRAVDYELALEQMLRASRAARFPEPIYDCAILMQEIPLPSQALVAWQQFSQQEQSLQWRSEGANRSEESRTFIRDREQRLSALTSSPGSFLAVSREDDGAEELVLGAAVENWLPFLFDSPEAKAALSRLASILASRHRDLWLTDLLELRESADARQALQSLSESAKANSRANHVRAGAFASAAQNLFKKVHNSAGVLRSRLEEVYALDRRSKIGRCLARLHGDQAEGDLQHQAKLRRYVWIGAQASLEEITCVTKTRTSDVVNRRKQATDRIKRTGYTGLYLRALSFQTEQYDSFDSRLRLWERGSLGLRIYWQGQVAPNRGYLFYYTLGSSAKRAGNDEAAMVFLCESLSLLQQWPNYQVRGLVLSELGVWQLEAGHGSDASLSFDEMEKLFNQADKSQFEGLWQEAEVLRAEAETKIGRPETCLQRLRLLTQGSSFPYKKFDLNVRRRLLPVFGNALLALGQVTEASKYFLQAISENRKKLKTVKNRQQRDNAQSEIEGSWRGLAEVNLKLGLVDEALTVWETFRGGRIEDTTPRAIRTPPGVSLLVYAFLQHGVSAWLVDQVGTEQHWLDKDAVAQDVRKFAELSADAESPVPDVLRASRHLYSLLIEPFAHRLLREGTLIIDADGPLGGLPWPALEDPSGHALIERFALSQAVGWAEVSSRSVHTSIRVKNPLIIAEPALGPEYSGKYPPLAETVRAARLLKQRLPAANYLEGKSATLKEILRYAPHSSIFYFAGHGVSHGGFGALLVAPAGGDKSRTNLLTGDQIASMNLTEVELVVLGACSSGEGEQSGVVNLDGLARAFLEAGAYRVVAARWQVDSQSTADLMTRFNDLILAGRGPADALREAALAVRGRPLTAHPYHWAAFQVFGAP
jgi:CHAT domain-containing protein